MSREDMAHGEPHGTRSCYQAGCRERACRAAEAAYRAQLRRDHAYGVLRPGMRLSAAETWKRIRQLKPEYGTYGHIARRLGLKRPRLEVGRRMVNVATMVRIRRLYRLMQLGAVSDNTREGNLDNFSDG